MGSITRIAQQERLKNRYSIYIDGKYAFSLSADVLLEQQLRPGQQVDDQQLKIYKKLSADDKAYGLVLAYVARRMRSEGELKDYFKRKGYEPELGEQILDKLKQLRLVDDNAFADAWVRNRRLLKSVSKRRLQQELKQKHVPEAIIERALVQDEANAVDVLTELIRKKRRQTRYTDNTKLMQYLARQGFSYDDIKRALHATSDDQ